MTKNKFDGLLQCLIHHVCFKKLVRDKAGSGQRYLVER